MSTQLDNINDAPEESADPIRYRSLSALAVFSPIVAAFSILTVFYWLFWIIPAAAIFLGWRAIKKVRHAPTELTGIGLARSGMIAAVALGFIGDQIHSYIQKHTIPYGYTRIDWKDIQPDLNIPTEIIPPKAKDLEPSDSNLERRIFIEGYIYPGRRMINIKEFLFVRSENHCNSCPQNLKSTEMISAKITPDVTPLEYTSAPIKIGGKFKIDPDQAANPFGGMPYQLEVDVVQQ